MRSMPRIMKEKGFMEPKLLFRLLLYKGFPSTFYQEMFSSTFRGNLDTELETNIPIT
jgi:hypothetical protein